MNSQLDILALEPFFGGGRKVMLDTILKNSRHHWTLLKLPPRRIERRLQAASVWFSEQLSRHWVGRVDVLFTSEALNLADMLRLVPELSSKPSVVYFHDNQLPRPGRRAENAIQLVNLSSAAAATEIWFNSQYHQRVFFKKATAVCEMHPELSGRHLIPELQSKTQVIPPPIDLEAGNDKLASEAIKRNPRTLFVDTRDADIDLLNAAIQGLQRRGEKFNLITVGPVAGLDEDIPRQTVGEQDELAQLRALYQAAVIVSARPNAVMDLHAIRGLYVGCWPIFPNSGIYPELLPHSLHELCLYDHSNSDKLLTQLQNVWWIEQPAHYQEDLLHILGQFDASQGVQAIDDRLEQIAIGHSLNK
jgi:hypothetical protein